MSWVVKDTGLLPRQEERVWGPFRTKVEARAWAKENLCDCCSHKAIRMYGLDHDDFDSIRR